MKLMTRLFTLSFLAFVALVAVFLVTKPPVALSQGPAFLQQDQPTSTPQPIDPGPPPQEPVEEEGAQQGEEAPVDWASVRMGAEWPGDTPKDMPVPEGPSEPPDATPEPVEPDKEPSIPPDQGAKAPPSETFTHVVSPGETLFKIALRYGIPMAQLISINGIKDPNRIMAGQVLIVPGRSDNQPLAAAPSLNSKAQPDGTTYTVQRGDTPFKIALRFGVNVQLLMTVNQIVDPRRLLVGQVLTIPGEGAVPPAAVTADSDTQAIAPTNPGNIDLYVVQRGDYLFRIALRFGVPMQTLVEVNNLENPHRINAGQMLIIPNMKAGGQQGISAGQDATQAKPGNPPSGGSFVIWPIPLQDGWIPKWYRADHPGIDIILPEGTPIHAAAAGTVEFSGWNAYGFGNLVVIDHGNGYRTLYAHQSQRLVSEKDTVAQGDIIGLVGITGHATDPHLHFEIRQGYTPVNPCDYLPGGCQ